MENNNNSQNNSSINSLPEYRIRTMQGDIDKADKGLSSPPDELPVVEIPKPVPTPIKDGIGTPTDSVGVETPIVKPIAVPLKPIEPPTPKTPEPPKPSKIEIPKPSQPPQPPKPKSSLPELEDFIVPVKPVPTPIKDGIGTPTDSVGVEPPKPLKIEQLKTEDIFDSEGKTNKKKFWLVIIGIVLLIAIILGFFYWRGTRPETNPTPQPTENKLQIPDSLINVDETKTLKLENNISLLILLEDEKVTALKTFRRIVPTKIATDGKEEVLSLNDLIKELNISVYPYVLSELKNNYTLVLYGQEENEKRLGIIIETNNNTNLKEQLRYWEKTMIENLYNLFLGKQPQIPTNKNFKDSNYNESPIRFINFPNPDISIDYATPNNLFILSTSKESIRAIIDRIK